MIRLLSVVCLSVLLLFMSAAVGADEPKDFVLVDHRQAQPAPSPAVVDPGIGDEGSEKDVSGTTREKRKLPVLDDALREKTAAMPPTEMVRVIIELDSQPHDAIADEVRAGHEAEMREIRERIEVIHSKYALQRNLETRGDAENYQEPRLVLKPNDRAELRSLNERHEALSLTVKNEITGRLSAVLDPYQRILRQEVESMGGEVEFGTICINALVARVPAGMLARLSKTDGVARVVADQKMKGGLTNADDATRVSDGGGLWENGATGGLYDPAVIDSGTDISHPGLEDTAGRTNYMTWYLVAGLADPNWDDALGINDLNGHGTHVMGIVGSYGTAVYPGHLGMSFGVEKAITLKAAWRALDGRAYMYHSDAMHIIDRALYDTDQLIPAYSFNDDVDGFNLSYYGDTSFDETDYSRFYDSIISSYADLVVTVCAGNTGPSNTLFTSPSCSYNVIAVANVEDVNTTSRDDDFIRASSTRGPTEDGRRKPDIAAPGTDIQSCNTDWETESDYINKSGTSMAAPMVLGVAMDLMDAGLYDELEIKALLLNTAQKNEGLIDFESDDDGWSEAYGWGYMNADAAYYHLSDVITATVTERPNPGYYRLYKGQMRDEGSSGEGRDRVTMVWNRHATYNPEDYPATYHNLSDLNLRLYEESYNTIIDYDWTGDDNVQQVRIDEGAGVTDVVVKAYAWSTDFSHGGDTETFALATEENFVEVDLPEDLQLYADYEWRVEPNEEVEISLYVVNNSDIASHGNQLMLTLPAGWSILSGSNPYNLGSIDGSGGVSPTAVFTVSAQSWAEYGVIIDVDLSHNSYGETWNAWGWNLQFDVQYDTTAPSPNPSQWLNQPYGQAQNQIAMRAVTASDDHEPVQYYFDFVSSPTGGSGGTDSGWQSGTTYADGLLQRNNRYGYRIRARDSAQTPNVTGYSSVVYVYTFANTPGEPGVTNPTATTLDVTIDAALNPSWTECAIYLTESGGGASYYLNGSGGSNGGSAFWQSISAWGTITATGLNPSTEYEFEVRARNGDGIQTGWSPAGSGTTSAGTTNTVTAELACVPDSGIVPFDSTMTVTLTNNYAGFTRRVAARVDAVIANGTSISNWKSGWSNIGAGESFVTSWPQSFPALGSVIGDNVFTLEAEDVTPAPYNQAPHPPSGDTDTSACMVTGIAP